MKSCRIEGCSKDVDSNGLCKTHASRLRRTGDPMGVRKIASRGTKVCIFPGCDQPHSSHGLCRGHRVRQIKYGDPALGNVSVGYRQQACSTGCGGPVGDGSNGMCRSCFRKTIYAANPAAQLAKNAARRAHTGQRSFPDEAEVLAAFIKARPNGADIDHILPLQAWPDLICGLHTLANVRYRPSGENRAAGSAPPPTDLTAWLEAELTKPEPEFVDQVRLYKRTAPVAPDRLCTVPGCTAKHYGAGKCRNHYRQARRAGGIKHNSG